MQYIPPAPAEKAPQERFTGEVYLSPLHKGEAPSRLVAALVHFAPGARTNWHSHPLGQTLHCTSGTGLVVNRDGTVILMRPGDTVHTPLGEEHWHGATEDSIMCHLVLVEHDDGNSANRLEPVTGLEYETAHTKTKETR